MTIVAGIDVQSIDEVEDSLARFGDRYRKKFFSDNELEECEENHEIIAQGLALRFAAKEAVLKVLRPNDRIPSWRTIEVRLPLRGAPTIVLTGEADDDARRCGIENISLSVRLARGYAIATVLAVVSRNAVEEHL